MRKIMVFQHVGHEPLGTLNPMLKQAGLRIRYVNFEREPDLKPDLNGYSGLVILGGPMGVYEAERYRHLKTEMLLIEEALKLEIPILGICLGSQLLSHVLGGPVAKAPHIEAGWCEVKPTSEGLSDPLFNVYSQSERIFQIHQDAFEVPKSATHLAFSPLFDGQAFRYRNNVYGLQFHLEVDSKMIQRWMAREDTRQMIERSNGAYNLETIAQETQLYMGRSQELSQHTFGKFIDLFELPGRQEFLGSSHGGRK